MCLVLRKLYHVLNFNYLSDLSSGHVIPPDQLLPIALTKGPSGVDLDFTYQSRDTPKMASCTFILSTVCKKSNYTVNSFHHNSHSILNLYLKIINHKFEQKCVFFHWRHDDTLKSNGY